MVYGLTVKGELNLVGLVEQNDTEVCSSIIAAYRLRGLFSNVVTGATPI